MHATWYGAGGYGVTAYVNEQTAFSSVQRDHMLCKYIIITYIKRHESCCSDSEVDKYSSILERYNAVEWHWMETARP